MHAGSQGACAFRCSLTVCLVNVNRTLLSELPSYKQINKCVYLMVIAVKSFPILFISIRQTTHSLFHFNILFSVSGDSDCFLFRLNPVASMFPSTGYNDHYVYFNSQQQSLPNGLGMGGQYNYWGLWIDSQFGFGECSESCTTFKDYKMLTNKKKFRISKMEAWGVGEPPPTPHERVK
ncbi:hypothetical protein J6590_100020 [Homalodisca vitripennis]|nr:hypothetical protein J6590_014237 [Homalodisca vitripennis]KAG8333950.1 hypothetical protein J6590_100020 [Homalodisca vitripennis]